MKAAATDERTFSRFLLMSTMQGDLAAREIGARIALARNEAGMTQEELAGLCSFSKRSLQDYETGVTIPWRHMREISQILRRPVPWLLHGERPDADAETPQLEQRLEELVSAVEVLVRQTTETREAVLLRLEEIERRLPTQNASGRPRGAGTTLTGSAATMKAR